MAPGDSVRLRFSFGNDGCTGVDGWYLDDVHVFACTVPTAVSLSNLETPAQPAAWPWLALVAGLTLTIGFVARRRRHA